MASSWNGSTGNGWLLYRLASVRNPVNKILLAEEPTKTTPDEMPPGWNGNNVIVDSRWEPGTTIGGGDTVTMRHSKKANSGFADAHFQTIDYMFAIQQAHIDPSF